MRPSTWLFGGLAAVALAVLVVTGVLATQMLESTPRMPDLIEPVEKPPLEAAAILCRDTDPNSTLESGDGGHTIIVEASGGALGEFNCVADRLGTSDAIVARIGATTALMGEQSAEQDGITYRWSSRPDNGVSMTIADR